ncbi:hypothetical protein N7454_002861 [Penicillium verhagenii]|nr:hypothetical protein N7454_002861 [Penicillium verhagenii]
MSGLKYLSKADEVVVERHLPRDISKAVARLLVAHPDPTKWQPTGLQGVIALCEDTVGHCFWLKMVDISPGGSGSVIWDLEIEQNFDYIKEREFFHSFVFDGVLFGLLFADLKEAKEFLAAIEKREKIASKETKRNPYKTFENGALLVDPHSSHEKKTKSRFGSLLHRSSHNSNPTPVQSIIPVAQPPSHAPTYAPSQPPGTIPGASPGTNIQLGSKGILFDMGITGDQIVENADFINDYIEQQGFLSAAQAPASTGDQEKPRAAPPPPPGPPAPKIQSISPQDTGSSSGSRRGPPPPPPPARKARGDGADDSIAPPPPRKSVVPEGPAERRRPRAISSAANPPPPPPRPPKTPMDETPTRFGVPPPFMGDRKVSAPPAPPSRSPVPGGPPPPPPRGDIAPQLPPKVPNGAAPGLPPPPPARGPASPPPPPAPRPAPPSFAPALPPPPPPRGPASPHRQIHTPLHHPLNFQPGMCLQSHLHLLHPVVQLVGPHPLQCAMYLQCRHHHHLLLLGATLLYLHPRLPLDQVMVHLEEPHHLLHPVVQQVQSHHHLRLLAVQGDLLPRQLRLADHHCHLAEAVETIFWPLFVVKEEVACGNAAESSAGASSSAAPQGGLAGALQDALKKRKQKVSGSDDEKEDDDDW